MARIILNRIFYILLILHVVAGLRAKAADSPVIADSSVMEEVAPFEGSKLYVPNDGISHPGVIVLHGSEGGSAAYSWLTAQYLASNGYAALAYCYFDCGKKDSPISGGTLAEVEIRGIFEAIGWLKNSSFVNGKKVAVYGFSRGAELSMILAEKANSDPNLMGPDAVLAHAPSDTSNPAWSWSWRDPRCWSCENPYDCSPNTPVDQLMWNPVCGVNPLHGPGGKPMWETLPAWKWERRPVSIGKRIEVEKYSGNIFLTVGTKDTVWPYEQTQRIEQTLKENGKTPEVHYFKGEDHVFKTDAANKRNELVLEFLKKQIQ